MQDVTCQLIGLQKVFFIKSTDYFCYHRKFNETFL